MKPWLRGRTLNVSMALAMLGLEIFRSASITSTSCCKRREKPVRVPPGPSDRVPPLLDEESAKHLDRLRHRFEIRVHGEGALEVRQGAGGLVELHVDHPVTAERAEVVGIALDHLVAVGQRFGVL